MVLVYCFEKLENAVHVDDKFIIPTYGDFTTEFNYLLKVVDVENKEGKIYIKLERY